MLEDARRLAIVEALKEGPRHVPELARLLGIHLSTVRADLDRLLQAGVLVEEPGMPGGRGRASKRYRLRQPLLARDPEVRLFVGSLVSLLRDAYGDDAAAKAEEEGIRRGRQLAPTYRDPSSEQAVSEVLKTLHRLSFSPAPPARHGATVAVDIHHCPFGVDPGDPGGAIVCAYHRGLIRALAEAASGQDVGVRLLPFVSPERCRIELSFTTAPASQATAKAAGPSSSSSIEFG